MAVTAHDVEYIGQLSSAKRLPQSYTNLHDQHTPMWSLVEGHTTSQ